MAARVTTRQRLVAAATDLFAAQGFEATTVDDIAAAAGVSRMTFFRNFPTKEEVVFPDHEALLAAVRARLDADTAGDWARTLREGAAIVLHHYLDEGAVAQRRYRLTSTVPALRDREVATVALYQRAFREYLNRVAPHTDETGIWAETLAAATVAAHNHVLRRCLRGEAADPTGELDAAMDDVIARFKPRPHQADVGVIAFRTDTPVDVIADRVRELVRG